MPKISHPLSESERILFHANYKYMWDKISTTYFAVLRSKTPPSAKIDEKKLPSYAICAKCNNDESYAPSRATIAKIVDFYNSQIRPPVEVYQFTHERLEDSDNIRYRSSSVFDPRFIGTYRGYYPSVTEDKLIIHFNISSNRLPAKEIIVILFVSIRILEYTSPPLFFISVKETCILVKLFSVSLPIVL